MNIAFTLNEKPASIEIEPRETLAEVLRGAAASRALRSPASPRFAAVALSWSMRSP